MSAFARRCGLRALDHAQNERITSAVPLECLELLLLHYLLELVEATDLISRDDCCDDEQESFKVETNEQAFLAIELLFWKIDICQIRILLFLLLLLHFTNILTNFIM